MTELRNLLVCPCCGGTPEFKYRGKAGLHCTWDNKRYFLPTGWEYSHFCPVDNGLRTPGGVGFATLHDAQRDWNYKVGSFLRDPVNSFHPFVETGAELLTELDDCFVGERLHLGDKVTLSRRSLTVRGVVQFIQRTSVGQISIILRDTDTIKFVIYTPVRERRKYMFSYHIERRFHWTKKPKGSSATHAIVDD